MSFANAQHHGRGSTRRPEQYPGGVALNAEEKLPQGKPRIIRVPPEFQVSMHRSDLVKIGNNISNDAGCRVVPFILNQKPTQFFIYGKGAQAETAMKAIHDFLERAQTKTATSTAWAKLPAFDFNRWWYEEVRRKEDEEKARFLEYLPPLDENVPCKLILKWPDNLINGRTLGPRDAFGNKLEALNHIRAQDECWIYLKSVNELEFAAYEETSANAAVKHVENFIGRIIATDFMPHQTNIILDEAEGLDVKYFPPVDWPVPSTSVVPRLLALDTMHKKGSFCTLDLPDKTLAKVQYQLLCSLESIKYERGMYDLSIRYGALALVGLKPDAKSSKHSIDRFLWTVDQCGPVSCSVMKWFGDRPLEDALLDRLMAADHLLEPVKTSSGLSGHLPDNLKDSRPVLRGSWVIQDPTNIGTNKLSYLAVQLEWTEDEDGCFEKMPAAFFKVGDKKKPREHLDINFYELGEGRGWHMGLDSMVPISKSALSPVVINFADRMKLITDIVNDTNSSLPFVDIEQVGKMLSVHVETGWIDRVYKFGIRKTKYQVEAVTSIWIDTKGKGRGLTLIHSLPSRNVIVSHKDWAMYLNPLEKLAPGEHVQFGDTVTTFFPEDGLTKVSNTTEQVQELMSLMALTDDHFPPPKPGIKLLFQKLMRLSAVINGKEHPDDKKDKQEVEEERKKKKKNQSKQNTKNKKGSSRPVQGDDDDYP